ncbi:MAG: hypothetical protein KC475_02035 [Cyanobacteria bacterium HKST-UBA03]|nr:hypothetical protein [Cyanobacteria bacterium HKST-UBA03]
MPFINSARLTGSASTSPAATQVIHRSQDGSIFVFQNDTNNFLDLSNDVAVPPAAAPALASTASSTRQGSSSGNSQLLNLLVGMLLDELRNNTLTETESQTYQLAFSALSGNPPAAPAEPQAFADPPEPPVAPEPTVAFALADPPEAPPAPIAPVEPAQPADPPAEVEAPVIDPNGADFHVAVSSWDNDRAIQFQGDLRHIYYGDIRQDSIDGMIQYYTDTQPNDVSKSFLNAVKANFDRIDANHDGRLDLGEFQILAGIDGTISQADFA